MSTKDDHDDGGVRLDKWLWAARLFKTRAEATDACKGGHVSVNGKSAKPTTPVAIGSMVEARAHGRHHVCGRAGLRYGRRDLCLGRHRRNLRP